MDLYVKHWQHYYGEKEMAYREADTTPDGYLVQTKATG